MNLEEETVPEEQAKQVHDAIVDLFAPTGAEGARRPGRNGVTRKELRKIAAMHGGPPPKAKTPERADYERWALEFVDNVLDEVADMVARRFSEALYKAYKRGRAVERRISELAAPSGSETP